MIIVVNPKSKEKKNIVVEYQNRRNSSTQGKGSKELLYILFMHRTAHSSAGYNRWQNYQGIPVSGSLILGPTSGSPKHYSSNTKLKYDELGFKHNLFVRHDSEKQFSKTDFHKNPPHFLVSQSRTRHEEDLKARSGANILERTRNSQMSTKPKSNSKVPQIHKGFFPARNSGGKANNPLKETSSTSNSNEGLGSYKSEKTFPSFLRNQSKSPHKPKSGIRGDICRQNFKFIKKLGQGKFGSVYLARQINTGYTVGLKVVEKKRILKDNFLTQLIRQLKIQSFLDHPNIIKVYGCFQDEDHVYIVLELGSDGQLFDVISGGTTLSQQTTSFIIGNLLDAIQLMHKHKILHRDIKPENIVLVHGNIKLCDFGWAVNKKQELRSTFCGTPLYLSPELLQGSRYDEKVDIWAVGILAYQLFYGNSPFDINEHQDLVKIVTNQIQYPKNKHISKEFKEFLSCILRKNPKERMECKELLNLQFIKKYWELETCEELCR